MNNKKKKILWAIVVVVYVSALAITFTSCNVCRYYEKKCPPSLIKNDSINNMQIHTVYIRDSIYIEISNEKRPLPTENSNTYSKDTARLYTSLAYAYAYIKDGYVSLYLRNRDSANLPVKYIYIDKTKYVNDSSFKYQKHDKTEIKTINKQNKWQIFVGYMGYAFLCIIIILIIISCRKIYKFF